MTLSILAVIATFSPLTSLLIDFAIKGTALLVLAAVVTVILRRDSAATRHLVWLLAIVSILVLPVLSAVLPQWRVLPVWTDISSRSAAAEITAQLPPLPENVGVQLDALEMQAAFEQPYTPANQSTVSPPDSARDSVPILATPDAATPTVAPNWNLLEALPLLWAMGCCVLILRLMAAQWMLWHAERYGTIVWTSSQAGTASNDPLVAALQAAIAELGMCRGVRQSYVRRFFWGRPIRVKSSAASSGLHEDPSGSALRLTLLIQSGRAIPLVWGIFRSYLLLPATARQWSSEQLRSVLLHELAHIKRHDTLSQLLTQIASALYWFDPLMWFASWRLGVERERACDDLVLASGVRPSAYAGHLLEAVTGLAPAHWTHSCGLAMARQSSIEGRLVAVLNKNLNRRGVSMTLAAVALTLAIGIAIPVAMLCAADEQPTDAVKTTEVAKPAKEVLAPKHESAQSLLKRWQSYARTDGKIPGSLIGRLASHLDTYLKGRPQDEKDTRLAELRLKLDATRDWTPADIVTLLDEITAISTAPISWADLPLRFDEMANLSRGQPLPAALATAAWGAPSANGLRVAWMLDPRAEQYPLGSVLKTRVLFHNAGKEPIVFMTDVWRQNDSHSARDGKETEIKVFTTWYSGVTPTATYRLASGEYCEVPGHGIAIGAGKYEEEYSTGSIGAIIEAKEGDDVTLSHSVYLGDRGWSRPGDSKNPVLLRKKAIADRVSLEAPMPQSAVDREQLIRRVMLDVFGEPPNTEEVAAFVADNSLDALEKLTTRLQAKPRISLFAGRLPAGETKFRVTARDPEAARKPRTANSPGRYILQDGVHLLVSQTSTETRRTNKAVIAFLSPDPKVTSPYQPREISLPDGLLTWAAVWERGQGELWVLQKDLVRKYDFTIPAQVKETRFEQGGIANVPEALRDALRKVMNVPDAPIQQQESLKPKAGTNLNAGTEDKLQWGETVNGLRMALVRPLALGEPEIREIFDFKLVVQNVSPAPIRLNNSLATPKSHYLRLKLNGRILAAFHDSKAVQTDFLLQPREVAVLRLFPELSEGASVTQDDPRMAYSAELNIETAPAGAWSGKLITADTFATFTAHGLLPKNKDARELYKIWNNGARRDGKIPGALIGDLANSMRTFVKNNPTWATTPQLVKMLPRLDATQDWSARDALSLLEDVAALQDTPIDMAVDGEVERTLRTGTPLPANLANAPWGAALPNGLRLAWLLEPRAAELRLNTPLKSRILIHNMGTDAVVFRTRTWHQTEHTALDAQGAKLKVDSIFWTTIGRLVPFRLAPGEFVELNGAGVGVGANQNSEDWQNTRVGSWVDAKAGDHVTVTSGPVPLSDWNEPPALDDESNWWLKFITARLHRTLPLTNDDEERKLLLYRAAIDLFGTPLSAEETAAFLADRTPNALDSLALRLAHRKGVTAYTGSLQSGSTKFRVLPADPDAAKKPRTACNPGRYTLAENAVLVVSRRPVGERLVNEASIQFYSPDPKTDAPGKPHTLHLPDGYDTWSAAWMRGARFLWVLNNGHVDRYDFTNPADVKMITIEQPEKLEKVPKTIYDALRQAIESPDTPHPAASKVAPPASPIP